MKTFIKKIGNHAGETDTNQKLHEREAKLLLVERGFILGACALCFFAGAVVALFFGWVSRGMM